MAGMVQSYSDHQIISPLLNLAKICYQISVFNIHTHVLSDSWPLWKSPIEYNGRETIMSQGSISYLFVLVLF